MQNNIDAIFSRNKHFSKKQAVPSNVIERYQGKLPDIVLEIWRQHGVGIWNGGLYQLCIPIDFDGLLSQIFHADDEFSHQDCFVIGYSAFGSLTIWSQRHWLVDAHLLRGEISCRGLIEPERKRDPNTPIATAFFGITKDVTLNAYDDDDKPLFARARKKLGDLEPGECYGFFPALAMGGAPKLENLKRVKALEHFLFLAQLQQFTLMDYLSRPIRAVRLIG